MSILPSRFLRTLNSTFRQYGIRFTEYKPHANGLPRALGKTRDEMTALEVVGQTPIHSMTLVGVCTTADLARRNGQLAQHILMVLLPGWNGTETWLVETLQKLAASEEATTTVEQVQSGYTIRATWYKEAARLVLHIERVV